MRFSKLIPPLLMLILTGCANNAPFISENNAPAYSNRQDAMGTLLEQALSAQSRGDYSAADGWLVRAMRINPMEPAVYYHMALLRKDQGQPDQARQLASRALSLGPNTHMKQALDQLLKQP